MLDSLLFSTWVITDQPQATKHLQKHVHPSYLSWCFSLDLSNDWFITQTHHTVEGKRNIFSPYTLQPPRQQEFQPASQLSPVVAEKHGTITMNNLSLPGTKFLVSLRPSPMYGQMNPQNTLICLCTRITRRTRRTTHDKFHYCPPKIVKRECRLRRCCCFSGLTKRQIKDTNLSDHVWRKGSKVLSALLHFANAWNQLKSDTHIRTALQA